MHRQYTRRSHGGSRGRYARDATVVVTATRQGSEQLDKQNRAKVHRETEPRFHHSPSTIGRTCQSALSFNTT